MSNYDEYDLSESNKTDYSITRMNRMNMTYVMRELPPPGNSTEVVCGTKAMIFKASIHEINRGWFQWMNGEMIQVAFPFLMAGEREFLMTGITPDEWDEMFKERE
jgi:hypothetical protein